MLRTVGWRKRQKKTLRQPTWYVVALARRRNLTDRFDQMREIAEIELAIQGGTEKIETLGLYSSLEALL